MEKELRHIKINGVLIIVYLIILVIIFPVSSEATPKAGEENVEQTTEVAVSVKYELPKMANKKVPENW